MKANSAGLTTLLSARVRFQSIFCIILCNLYLLIDDQQQVSQTFHQTDVEGVTETWETGEIKCPDKNSLTYCVTPEQYC